MNQALRKDAQQILASSLQAVLPDEAVQRALRDFEPHGGRVLLVAAGKAAWQMAAAAVRTLGRVDGGVVVTKYHHVKGDIPGVVCCEGGHPVPDEGSFAATQKALELVQDLTAADDVLFLLSGGGSALFEKPLVPGAELQDITGQLLGCGADIVEMDTIRKRLSAVKGERFARLCAPAQVYSIVLSDILGDPLDMIASGPACPDSSTCADALAIAEKYQLKLSPEARALLEQETPKTLDNVTTRITGSVRELCAAAAKECSALGCPRHCRAGCSGVLRRQRWHRWSHRCSRRLCGRRVRRRSCCKGAGCVRGAAEQRCLPCTESSGWSAGDRTYRNQRERCGSGTAARLTGKRRNIP